MKNINLSETSVPFHLQLFKGLPTSFTIDSTLIQVIAFHHLFHFYSVCFALWIFFYIISENVSHSPIANRGGKREQIVIEFADLSVNEICEHLSRPSIWSVRLEEISPRRKLSFWNVISLDLTTPFVQYLLSNAREWNLIIINCEHNGAVTDWEWLQVFVMSDSWLPLFLSIKP